MKALQQEKCRRNKSQKQTVVTPEPYDICGSPTRDADSFLRANCLSPTKYPAVRNEMVNYNVLAKQIKHHSGKKGTTRKELVQHVISGNIIQKYRKINSISKKIGFNRRTVGKYSKREPFRMLQRKHKPQLQVRKTIIDFMERDDNSRTMPGKQDSKHINGKNIQKKVLSDYLHNLHGKFLSENPNTPVSRSLFSKCRPAHVLLCKFCGRQSCLCQRHENFALKLKCIKKMGGVTHVSPDKFANEHTDEQVEQLLTQTIQQEPVVYEKWKALSSSEEDKGTRLFTITATKEEFITEFMKDLKEFRGHMARIQIQYSAVRFHEENLKDNSAIAQLDFGQSYTAKAHRAPQNAYFNEPQVTIHPIVLYTLAKQYSFCFISDSDKHDWAAVLVIIAKFLQYIKEHIIPGLLAMLYVSDSPFTQYRNKYIFHELLQHYKKYGTEGEWLNLEAGHGKGPCDGLAAVIKRLADQAVRSKGERILDAKSFFKWATEAGHNITYLWYGAEEVEAKRAEMEEIDPLAVPGTGKCHAAKPAADGQKISIRETSCAGPDCKCGPNDRCPGWSDHDVEKVFLPDQWVAAVRSNEEVHLGQIQTYARPEMTIKFLCKQEDDYAWPAQPDIEAVPLNRFLCKVAKPRFLRKTQKFRFTATTLNKVQRAYENYQQN